MSTRVLIIDPNIPFMVSIKQALEGTGEFEVSVSANGLAAQDALRQAAHDIAVIDFNVADMDIIELVAQVRRIQPDLRILLSYTHDEQAGRAAHLGAHAIIAKPYTARDLIVQLHRLLARRAPGQMPPVAEQPRRAEEPPAAPFIDLPPEPAPPAGEPDEAGGAIPTDADLRRLAQTHYFGDEPDPADTNALHEWQDTERTGKLRKTDALDDLIEKHGWVEGDATPPFLEEIAPREDDTPTVPTQDLNGVRQFLATDEPVHDPTTFGEVLDALAQTPPPAAAPSPDDQAFHDLVNSLRTPSAPARRGTLEDLLTSIGAGTAPLDGDLSDAEGSAPVNPLDYVLDSIRRGQPAETDPETDAALDDATIGDVIGGLFDPSFESVLAALAGEEVEDDDFAEPTYSEGERAPGAGIVSGAADRIALDDFESGDDMPDWLKRMDMPEPSPSSAPEPPLSEDDSSHYPATAALSAVSDEEQKTGFSLNELLSQIEQQLPPPRDQRPRLRPLPSWEQNASPEEAEQLRQVFPAGEEWEPADIEQIFSAPPVRESENWIERVEGVMEPGALEAALPEPAEPAAALAPDEGFNAGWDAFEDETPGGEALPADFRHLLDHAGEAEPAERDEPDRMALELELDEDLIEAVQRAEADTPVSAPPVEDEDTLATEITEAFYEGVRQTVYDWDDAANDRASHAAAQEWETAPDAEIEEEPVYADAWREAAPPPAYENHLVELPVETAARLLSVEPEPEPEAAPVVEDGEVARLARIALQLTQFSLESSAQATVLTYQGELIAEAGDLPRPSLERLERAIETAWSTSPPDYDSLSRFVTLPGVGEFLLFSMSVANGMTLSMVFNASTPVRTIRRQARRLSESLELVPEPAETPEPPAATTRPARPTDLRAPEGLHAAAAIEQPAPAATRPHPDTPYAGYTVLWLPWDPRLELGGAYAEALSGWIAGIAQERAWDIDALAIEADYVEIALKVPQKNLPDVVIHTLFDETARRTAEHFPELIDGAGRLWANGYYVVTPPRNLSEREIGRFITYQRQAQTG